MESILQIIVKWGWNMDTVIEKVRDFVSQRDDRMTIGISGHGAAGKSTFARQLAEKLGKEKINYIHTDPYIISSNLRKHAAIDYTYEGKIHRYKMTACHPDAHFLPALERDIIMVRSGIDFYTIGTHYSESVLISSEKQINIIEGMSVAYLDPALLDVGIYLFTDGETEFQRRSVRDVNERGMDLTYLQHSHEERRIQYELFMHPFSDQFDIIVKQVGATSYIEKDSLNL